MLERSLTYLMSSIAQDGIGAANALFERRFGWSVRELRVLRLVRAHPGITFTALAQATKFERTLTSRTVTQLIRAGLVTRANSARDGRIFTLSITPAGEAVCAEADPMTVALEELMLAPLAAPERAALQAMLERVRDWVKAGYPEQVARHYPELAPRPSRKPRPAP